jgi:hypothetical protein
MKAPAVRIDTKQLAELVGQKHGIQVESSDPIVLAASIVEQVVGDMHTKMLAEVTEMVKGLAAEVSTAIVLAENTAKARAESIVTDAGKWGSDQIRQAGADVAVRLAAELKAGTDETKTARREAKVWARFSMAAAAGSMVAAMVVIAWQVWGPA